MSFFCGPMRLRNKKRRGSGDAEALLRDPDGFGPTADPASQMAVRHDFVACLKDELSITRGQTVDILDVDRKWAYVAGPGGRGFVPLSCLEPAPEPRGRLEPGQGRPGVVECSQRRLGAETVFAKAPLGRRCVALYDFAAGDENDLSVSAGERVAALNEEDPEWTWVRRSDGAEGFVPRAYLFDEEVDTSGEIGTVSIQDSPSSHSRLHKLQLCGTELMSLYDYQGRIADDLTVVRGDLLYADMSNQTHDEWLWAYCPRTQTCGFIPKGYARPPALE